MAGITSDLAKKSGDPTQRVSGGLQTISAGTTLLVHTVRSSLSLVCGILKNDNFFVHILLNFAKPLNMEQSDKK